MGLNDSGAGLLHLDLEPQLQAVATYFTQVELLAIDEREGLPLSLAESQDIEFPDRLNAQTTFPVK